MKATFKPLGLAAAVAAVSAGYAGVTNAQSEINPGNTGDVAIVPYYTVQADWVTGVHITNTSDLTQVIKLRLRRGDDSMDALDFNIILSPYDVWTGLIKGDDDDNVTLNTGDTSCTAPLTGGKFPMPVTSPEFPAFNVGGMEGYIEIIGMGAAPAGSPMDVAATHTALGIPLNCTAVETNFFRNATAAGNGDLTKKGVISGTVTHQDTKGVIAPNNMLDTGNVLSVSYFIRDNASGVEFGSNAVHITDFNDEAMMSNQARLVSNVFDPYGFYFPDLDGGPGDGLAKRELYDANVRPALGVLDVLNDWSVGNADNQIQTDWVITLPGQYLMVDFARYVASLFPVSAADVCTVANNCDHRDIPVVATFSFWDREEQTTTVPEDGLVISPATGAAPASTLLPNEVNVIKWDASGLENADVEGVLNSEYGQTFDVSAFGAENGWATLAITPSAAKAQAVCEVVGVNPAACTPVANVLVPMVGFAAWQRTLPSDPSASYGRIIDHAFMVSSASSS
ncbi:MAG: hypothetical protein V7746_11250 [Halioglobus sp.]